MNTYGYVGGNPLYFSDPLGLFRLYGYQNRGAGNGWETQYEIHFDPMSDGFGDASKKVMKKLFKRMSMIAKMADTDPVGPLRPLKDAKACRNLDSKLEKEASDYFDEFDRLTPEDASDFLQDMWKKYPELQGLYGSPNNMLKQAEKNSKDNWLYKRGNEIRDNLGMGK